MLKPRVIVFLALSDGELVNTVNFKKIQYVGDPINTARIFSEKGVDEIFILDIDASRFNVLPNFDLLSRISRECRVPLGYAGGVNKLSHVREIVSLGFEKVGFGNALINEPSLIPKVVNVLGSQSVVGILNVFRAAESEPSFVVSSSNLVSPKQSSRPLSGLIKLCNALSVGEIVINNIDRDGTMKGYDHQLLTLVRSQTEIPITFVGGASNTDDINRLSKCFGYVGAGATTLFVSKGERRTILLSYPAS